MSSRNQLSALTRLLTLFVLCLAVPAPGAAESQNKAEFVIKIRGITAGIARLTGIEQDGLYAVRAEIESARLVKVFRPFTYRGAARGGLEGRRLSPVHYEDTANTGRRQSEVVLDYDGGVPRVTRYVSTVPNGADSPDPATQGGTLDPLSALYAVLRDAPAADLCDKRLVLFDGRRRSAVILGTAQAAGDGIVCNGEFRRLKGFTQKELSRHRAFPLQVFYTPRSGGMLQAQRVSIQSIYGLATLDRR